MPDTGRDHKQDSDDVLGERVGAKEARKLRARRRADRGVWFGLGAFGVIGWSVAVPTLLGLALGIWIDKNLPGRASWTLMLMLGGLAVGCLSAWRWIKSERAAIQDEEQPAGRADGPPAESAHAGGVAGTAPADQEQHRD
jgi:ATP synthase protein I